MANICANITACVFDPVSGEVRLQFTAAASDGNAGASETAVDFNASSTLLNANVAAAVEAYMLANFGTVVGPLDKVLIFGGRVL